VHRVGGAAAWLGGRDLNGGGTWLGLNEHAMIVAVTNRPKANVASSVRSRGLLCRDLLACTSVAEAVGEAERQMAREDFAGFNLLLLSARECTVIEAGDQSAVIPLTAGVHIVANRGLNDVHDPRVERATVEVDRRSAGWTDWRTCLDQAKAVCSLPAAGDLPALCLTDSEWGTVSSTIIALPEERNELAYLHAPGPPIETEYDDYSVEARRLLQVDGTSGRWQ
jgi:uncharacterized protein with NRDE domain